MAQNSTKDIVKEEIKVLVIDDDVNILEAISFMLEIADYNVITDTGDNIHHKIISKRPHVILLDVLLSGKDGRTVCRELKSTKDLQNIPLILISAHVDVKASAKACGADDYLEKPFDMDLLLEKIEKFTP